MVGRSVLMLLKVRYRGAEEGQGIRASWFRAAGVRDPPLPDRFHNQHIGNYKRGQPHRPNYVLDATASKCCISADRPSFGLRRSR